MKDNESDARVLWVSGAGSGMGRAVAVSAARRGYRVVLSGRRAEALEGTAKLIAAADGECKILAMDATSEVQVAGAYGDIRRSWGAVTHLVLAAGLNNPKRYWRDQSMLHFTAIVQTNLVASANVADAALGGMRDAGDGVVVFVSSFAGWRFSADAGVAYSASKTALSSLSESLNAQENGNGIRACHLCPGDVDTEFLAMRPTVPGSDARRSMLAPADIAAAVQFVLDSPRHVCINELVITPAKKK